MAEMLKLKKGLLKNLGSANFDAGSLYITTDEVGLYIDTVHQLDDGTQEEIRARIGDLVVLNNLEEWEALPKYSYSESVLYYITNGNMLLKYVKDGVSDGEDGLKYWIQINSVSDDDSIAQTVSSLEQAVGNINSVLEDVIDNASNAKQTAERAEGVAGEAKQAAERAEGVAGEAKQAADRAEELAGAASLAAGNAASDAKDATDAAASAEKDAKDAKDAAAQAAKDAKDAKDAAEQIAIDAKDATDAATAAGNAAANAEQSAKDAAKDAKDAADLASTANQTATTANNTATTANNTANTAKQIAERAEETVIGANATASNALEIAQQNKLDIKDLKDEDVKIKELIKDVNSMTFKGVVRADSENGNLLNLPVVSDDADVKAGDTYVVSGPVGYYYEQGHTDAFAPAVSGDTLKDAYAGDLIIATSVWEGNDPDTENLDNSIRWYRIESGYSANSIPTLTAHENELLLNQPYAEDNNGLSGRIGFKTIDVKNGKQEFGVQVTADNNEISFNIVWGEF